MRVLVTGGAGFIGSHIVDRLLAQGHEPAVLDDLSSGMPENVPAGVPLYRVDIRDRQGVREAFAAAKPQRVCHQAAQLSVSRSVREPSLDAEINVIGMLNVLEASAEQQVDRFVFASSGGVLYGDVTTPAPEETPANPISPYGITKWVGERYLRFFSAQHGLETVALRYSNVYGPRQNPHGEAGVVAIFNTRLLGGDACRVNGDGKYIRDYVYVTDVAAANVLALTAQLPDGKHHYYNVGTGAATDVNELEDMLRTRVMQILKSRNAEKLPAPPEHGPSREGDLRSNLIDASKLQRDLGWSPEVAVDHGLRMTVDWFAARELGPAS